MDSPLHKYPFGLLAAFNLKVQGQAPDKFSDTIAPVCDVLDFYLQEEVLTTFVSNSAAQAVGDEAKITVPAGEAWVVYNISTELACSATTTFPDGCTILATLSPGNLQRGVPMASSRTERTAALAAPIGLYCEWNGRRLCGPGAIITGLLVSTIGVAPATLTIHAQYGRILL